MQSINAMIVCLLLTVISISVFSPLQPINAQTFESNSTQANITSSSSPIQWAVYTNDKFGLRIDYPQSWIIEEKQNRFESGVEAAMIAPDNASENWGRVNFVYVSPATTSNIQVLTNIQIDDLVGGFDVDYDRRLIESANITKYQIGGERAGAFTYVLDKKDFTGGEETTTPETAVEAVTTIHDGKEYLFSFVASPEDFDNIVSSP